MNDVVDQQTGERFAQIHAKALHCQLFDWRKGSEGNAAYLRNTNY
jgi:uncharacterized protein (DUF924 family)